LKKKKLKINISKPVGQCFVFDEEGKAWPPLAAFSNRQGGGDEEEQTTVWAFNIKTENWSRFEAKGDIPVPSQTPILQHT